MEKYLQRYAEPESAALDGLPEHAAWRNVMVIPACNESPALLRPPPRCDGRSLMILVINETGNARPNVSSNNRALAAAVQERFAPLWQSATDPGLTLWRDGPGGRDLLLVDRFSQGRQIPAGGGVGTARKIGADVALGLVHRRRIDSGWIHCTDADVRLPETYFQRSNAPGLSASKYSALVYPFRHSDDPGNPEGREVVMATQLYELSLRYYVAGMKFARSPYAFHTIGSTMAVSAPYYAKVRGFPKREAGEDFYLLNKLAKVAPVLELDAGEDNEVIQIESRRSDRVPFGTGAAVNKITAYADPVDEFRFYDPAVFSLLKIWLQSFPALWHAGSAELDISIYQDQAPDHRGQVLQSLVAGLRAMKTEQALEHALRQSSSLEQFTRQLHTWFDALRTLKLIHFLRDRYLPSVAYSELESSAVYQHLLTRAPDLLAFHNYFRKFLESEAANFPGSDEKPQNLGK